LGAAWDRSLFYVKGGGAFAHDKFFTTTVALNPAQTATDTRWGWMVGAGWEYAFAPNWSAKIEYEGL
jgi:outer membrane immunogenic protein